VASPAKYAELFAQVGARADVWESTYLQLLDPEELIAHPVLEWVRGTVLRRLLDILPPEQEVAFTQARAPRLGQTYPRTPYGVPFPFRPVSVGSTRYRQRDVVE